MDGIVQRVLKHAEREPERLCVHTVSRRRAEVRRTFGEVAQAAGRAAAYLQARGIGRGDIVVLMGTHHVDLYATWLGAVWLGAVPTILAEPSVRVDRRVYAARLKALLEKIGARMLAHDPSIELAPDDLPRLVHVTYEEVAAGRGAAPTPVMPREDDLLLLQHSSGTTGLQKGVMLSHGAVMRHAEAYRRAIGLGPTDVIASWLPLYHDMGFVACFLGGLIDAVPVVWLSPFEWVASPALLLEAVERFEATLTWLPNFAFAFLAKRVDGHAEGLELGSLRAVVNCSEPVTTDAVDALATRFDAQGLKPHAMHACYAMAENVFAVTTTSDAHPARRRAIRRGAWLDSHRAVPASGDDEAIVHMSCGVPVEGCRVRVCDDHGALKAPGEAGRILIQSPFLFDGYFERPELNAGLFDGDGFYDTGDVGYVDDDGHLYVTGRRKDLVIVGGRNVYPTDIEDVVGAIDGVHAGRVVCFGVPMAQLATEGLVVLVESDLEAGEWKGLERRMRREVPTQLDLDLVDVRVVPRGRLRKSTSGKLARSGNREWYLAGEFGEVPRTIRREDDGR